MAEEQIFRVREGRRRDLQGLRAVAVLLVAFNHAGVGLLPGGYIGVDVFFVLSGYFITNLLLRDILSEPDAHPRPFSLLHFYERRARRILPAACLTLVVTAVAVYVIYDLFRADYIATQPTLRDVQSASLFYANFHFAAIATNYFAQTSGGLPSPVQHFWSLSVEEQFYLVWPPLLAVTVWLARFGTRGSDARTARRLTLGVLAVVIVLGGGASFFWSVRETLHNPQFAYFSTPVRAWEFGVGAAVAWLSTQNGRSRLAPLVRPILLAGPWIGLVMIAGAAILFSSGTLFPGYVAAMPVLGAALIIVGDGGGSPSPFSLARLLGSRPLAYIGDRSYSFYLWHYVALVLVWQAYERVLPVGANLLILLGAFGVSVVTYRWYENPLRFAPWLAGRRLALGSLAAVAITLAAVLIPYQVMSASLAARERAAEQFARIESLRGGPGGGHVVLTSAPGQSDPTNLTDSAPIPALAAAVAGVRGDAPLPIPLTPTLQTLAQENSSPNYDIPTPCMPRFGPHAFSRVCGLGDPRAPRSIVVFGDSHAQMWVPALLHMASSLHVRVVPLVKPGCNISLRTINKPGWPCATWFQWALERDRSVHPVLTVVSFELSQFSAYEAPKAISDLQSVFTQVDHPVLLADPPGRVGPSPTACLGEPAPTMANCATRELSGYTTLMNQIAATVKREHVPALPTAQWFCEELVCPVAVGGVVTTHDNSHVTPEYSSALSPLLKHELGPVLRAEVSSPQ